MKRANPKIEALALILLIAATGCATPASPGATGSVSYAWTQLGSGSTALVRALTDGDCPDLTVDGETVHSGVFAPPNKDFPMTTCQAEISSTSRVVTIGGRAVPAPPSALKRVAVVGDIGCYLKKETFQACLDPSQFPAKALANQIANAKPDLIIFVGDIYYSQTECPPSKASECGGVPTGDNWATWAYDFFDPYAPALSAAPWVFARGNHESCDTKLDNGGPGWFQLLAPSPGKCSNYTDPYRVDVLDQSLVIFDSAIANDTPANAEQAKNYKSNFQMVHELAKGHPGSWFVDHRPIWAAEEGDKGPTALNLTLQEAVKMSGNTLQGDVSLILSGHLHSLAYYNFADNRPPQVVSGGGSARLGKHSADFTGQTIDGMQFGPAELIEKFGYVQLDRSQSGGSWDLDFVTLNGASWKKCAFSGSALSCN